MAHTSSRIPASAKLEIDELREREGERERTFQAFEEFLSLATLSVCHATIFNITDTLSLWLDTPLLKAPGDGYKLVLIPT